MPDGRPAPHSYLFLHGGAWLPRIPDLPAGQQVLGLPGHRDGIVVVLAAVLLAVTFWVLKRRDA
jgi:hypothetical protein